MTPPAQPILHRKKRRHSSAFTLLEMIVVMAAIVIMTTLVVPAVTSLGRSTGMTTGGNLVTNLVSYARQMAVAKNTMTALVVLARQDSPDDFGAITVLEYDPTAGWNQITEWKKLPTGIVFDPNTTDSTFLDRTPSFPFLATTNQNNPPVNYKSVDGSRMEPVRDPAGYGARIFLPSGGLQNPEDPARLRLVEGYIQGGQVVRTRRAGTTSANFYDVSIIGATGVTKVSRP
jgi:competence protein ComGC